MGLVTYVGPSLGGVEFRADGVRYFCPKDGTIEVPDDVELLLLAQGTDWSPAADGAPVYTPPPHPRFRPVVVDESLAVPGVVPVFDGSSWGSRRPGAPVDAFGAYGHSYAAGVGAAAGAGYVEKMARLLKASTAVNRGVGGAQLGAAEGGPGEGGIGAILQGFVPGRTAAPYLSAFAPGAPGFQFVDWHYGTNDAGEHDLPEAFRHAVRSSFARLRAARVFEEDDASLAFVGYNAGTLAYTLMNSGSAVRQMTAGAATVTWTLPADFEGGAVAMRWVYGGNYDSTITFTVDGVAAGSLALDKDADHYPGNGSVTHRLVNLTPGAHTIVATIDPLTTIWFDCAEIEGSTPPLILAHSIMRLPDYTAGTAGTYPVPLSDARIDAYNRIIEEVAAEFDERVRVVRETEDILLTPGRLADDSLHPNEVGHAAIASATVGVLESLLTPDDVALLA